MIDSEDILSQESQEAVESTEYGDEEEHTKLQEYKEYNTKKLLDLLYDQKKVFKPEEVAKIC